MAANHIKICVNGYMASTSEYRERGKRCGETITRKKGILKFDGSSDRLLNYLQFAVFGKN